MSDFWTNNPTILFDKYYDIVPSQNMKINEQLNTITRLLIYLIILILLFNFNSHFVLYCLLIILIIVIFYYVNEYDPIIIDNSEKIKEDYNTTKNYDSRGFPAASRQTAFHSANQRHGLRDAQPCLRKLGQCLYQSYRFSRHPARFRALRPMRCDTAE